MKRYSYGERDYAFGQRMLSLRTRLGLTQAGLAALLGVSRRAVAEWYSALPSVCWRENSPCTLMNVHYLLSAQSCSSRQEERQEEQRNHLWDLISTTNLQTNFHRRRAPLHG
jgi:transcriptional regulator with XRE-family HTH domain